MHPLTPQIQLTSKSNKFLSLHSDSLGEAKRRGRFDCEKSEEKSYSIQLFIKRIVKSN